ncbi:hypothetical protein EsH8_VI_001029 [Colletotrichum jinshuiense]
MYIRTALFVQAFIAFANSASTLESLTSCLSAASVPVASSLPTSYNIRLPYKPLVVAIPTTVSQISSAVKCGAQNGVSVSAKSGGHSYTSSGFGGEDGHLVVNLDRIVGVGGHSLHGGHGMVSRKYGLATDWIKGATVVLANGTITYCSATERPNLFWSIRGAGSSMVIVAELDFNTFAAPEQVTYFDISLTWDAKKVPQVLLDTQEFAKIMPAELTLATTFNNDGYYLNGAYVGVDSAFRSAIQPLLTKLGAKVSSSKTVGWIEFIKHYAGTTEIDITTPTYNEHENFYASSIATPFLSKAQLESLVNAVNNTGFTINRSWFMHMNFHGGESSAITRPKPTDTAYVHRDKMLLFQLKDSVSQSQKYPTEGFSFLQGLRQSISKGLASNEWGMYANYPDSEIGSDAPRLYWGNNLDRLEWVKEDYDPTNLFRHAQSIKPAV